MLNLITLLTFLRNDSHNLEYDRCIERIHCPHDNESIQTLPKPEKDIVLKCRVERMLKCLQPDEHESN